MIGTGTKVRQQFSATKWSTLDLDPVFELLWVKGVQGNDVFFIGALYHPPSPVYQASDLLNQIEHSVFRIQQDFPDAHVILAGDLNTLSDSELIIRTGLTSIVDQSTRGNNKLDRVYVSDVEFGSVKVVKSAVPSDHLAIVAYTGSVKTTVGKTRRVCSFRKHTTAQHAHFLATVTAPIHVVNPNGRGDPQEEFDRLYSALLK